MKSGHYGLRKLAAKWRYVLAGLVVVGVICVASGWRERSVERRLAAIYAAHVLTPEENAATIYSRVLATELEAHLMPPAPGMPGETYSAARPPLSDEERMGLLLEAAGRPQCYFAGVCNGVGPVPAMRWTLTTANARRITMTRWEHSLLTAAFDDLEQGRLDAAKEKLYCVVQMAAHLRQQPTRMDVLTAGTVEQILWSGLCEFIVDHNATDEHLAMIEGILPSLADAWAVESAEMRQVEIMLDARSTWDRLKSLINGRRPQRAIDGCAQMYRMMICDRRGVRILIELQRSRNKSGRWARTLDDIRARLPVEALSNPFGPGELGYELTSNGFHLYGLRPNPPKVVRGPGDRPKYAVWPRRGVLKHLQSRQSDTSQTAHPEAP